jgi:hypothetical protein
MVERYRPLPPALKHGAFSGMGLLPGEDRSAFVNLHNALIAEYAPIGRHEESIVETMAQLVWRKQNLRIYRLAAEARRRCSEIREGVIPEPDAYLSGDFRDPDDIRQAEEAAEKKIHKELEWALELVNVGDLLTMEHLMTELAVVERLDASISRSLKQLLFVRGLKSLPAPASAPKQIAKAA